MQPMARLNEPPLPASESIDALKRRFVRQNREIARANSTQSVRIRNLECEVSRLLGENVSLREQIIKLHYELEQTTNKAVLESVDTVKGRLETKLSELGNLVRELGEVQKTSDAQLARKRKSLDRKSPKRSPDQRNWRNTLTFSEVVGSGDGRLPPIVEDKYYPRRTLDAEELLEAFPEATNVTDSPDLGPPPIAHFDEGDPIKFDSTQGVTGPSMTAANSDDISPKLSANLETRKKRRESSYRREDETKKSSRSSISAESLKKAESENPQPLKSGAKRKLNVREEEDSSAPTDVGDKDSRQLDRTIPLEQNIEAKYSSGTFGKTHRATHNRPGQNAASSTHAAKEENVEGSGMKASTTSNSNVRKVLGPKNVNCDPMNSPLKTRNRKDKVTDAKDNVAPSLRDRNRVKDRNHPKAVIRIKDTSADNSIPPATTIPKHSQPPPETPVVLAEDLFSPAISNPSAPRAESNDTPPPPDLEPNTGTGSFGRASRRPKGNVNYAQPNLRDKMRRPTAELVDAVAAERARQASLAMAEGRTLDAIHIKQEDISDSLPQWKPDDPRETYTRREEPASPLSNKTRDISLGLPPHVTTERRGRSLAAPMNDEENNIVNRPSGAASAIAALTSGSHKSKRKDRDKHEAGEIGDEALQNPTERPSIYDFTGSSPHNGEDLDDIESDTKMAQTRRPSRRHSSVPAASEHGRPSSSTSHRSERRKEITLEGRQGPKEAKVADRPLSRTKSVLEVRGDDEEPILGRGERIASRRRSMML